jgi:hypothetical protein
VKANEDAAALVVLSEPAVPEGTGSDAAEDIQRAQIRARLLDREREQQIEDEVRAELEAEGKIRPQFVQLIEGHTDITDPPTQAASEQ